MWKWFCSFAIIAGAIISVAYEQHYAREKYQAQSQADCIALSISIEEKHSCTKEAQSRKDYTPWWNALVTWPDGITTWAIIATGFVIAWQSSETRRAAKATERSVELAATANSQWIRLKLLDMYSEAERNAPDPPREIVLKCRWIILNPSSQPLTLHWVKVGIARDEAWHVCEFDFEKVIAPGEEDKIVIVPIHLGEEETAEYLRSGVEYSASFGVRFTGVNGRLSYQGWGDLFFFRKGKAVWNASLGKGPQREYDETFENEGLLVDSKLKVYERPKTKKNPN